MAKIAEDPNYVCPHLYDSRLSDARQRRMSRVAAVAVAHMEDPFTGDQMAIRVCAGCRDELLARGAKKSGPLAQS